MYMCIIRLQVSGSLLRYSTLHPREKISYWTRQAAWQPAGPGNPCIFPLLPTALINSRGFYMASGIWTQVPLPTQEVCSTFEPSPHQHTVVCFVCLFLFWNVSQKLNREECKPLYLHTFQVQSVRLGNFSLTVLGDLPKCLIQTKGEIQCAPHSLLPSFFQCLLQHFYFEKTPTLQKAVH